eukprot:8649381-Alexandrium_andersonii.AAC.1
MRLLRVSPRPPPLASKCAPKSRQCSLTGNLALPPWIGDHLQSLSSPTHASAPKRTDTVPPSTTT